MQIKKKTKYLLTTSEDKDVIVAEVPHNYKFDERGEYIVSKGFVDANLKAGLFTDMTGKLGWDGKIWVLSSDIE
jgi:hypothetical protein